MEKCHKSNLVLHKISALSQKATSENWTLFATPPLPQGKVESYRMIYFS